MTSEEQERCVSSQLEGPNSMENVIRMIKYGLKQQLSRFEVIKYQVLSLDNQSSRIMAKWHHSWVISPPAFLSLSYLAPSHASQLMCLSRSPYMKQYKPISSIFDPSSEVICPQMIFNFPPTLAYKGFKLCFSPAFIFTLS